MTVTQLVTHSGGFHADELLSSVVLTRLFPGAEIIRTRDSDMTTARPGRIVYDVGRAYDPALGIFDHHQRDVPRRADGAPYSSFGLVWRHFGRDYLRALHMPDHDLDTIHAGFDTGFVLPIDLMDNGVLVPGAAGPQLAQLTLPVLLESLKPAYDDRAPDADDRAFAQALTIARSVVEAAIAQRAADLRAAATVQKAIAEAGSGHVLELPTGMPYRQAVEDAAADHLLFVVHPRGSDWALNGIRVSDSDFALRADLPAHWAGLTDDALQAASGIPGARFCHNGRFIAVADNRDAILRMAELAVAEALGR